MKKTGFLYDDRYLKHTTGPYHPEIPQRLEAIRKGVLDTGLMPHLTAMSGSLPDMKWIEMIHEKAYIDRFRDACEQGLRELDYPDNQMCPDTWEAALLAVGGILDAVDRVMQQKLDNAFCAVRPPGHHAEADRAMGFCYFANVAIAAKYLQYRWGLQRVGVVDFDVHHGNGTQHLLEDDPGVFYYSIHQHPSFAFPGTGRDFEKGTGTGRGFTLNSPVLPGQGDAEYRVLMERDLLPAFEQFMPEFILVSTGFDAHEDDDMSDINLSTDGFSWIMQTLVNLAGRYCGGRMVSVLEGGYALNRLPELAGNHIRVLLEA